MKLRTKIFLGILLTAIVIGAALAFFTMHPHSKTVAAVDACKDEHLPPIGGVNGVEIRLTRVTCGLEEPYYEISAPSAKVSEEQAVEHAFTFSVEPECEHFTSTLYTSGDLIIGCCPMPPVSAGAGAGERELVRTVKVNVANGTFAHQDFQEFIINSGNRDSKTEKPSCSNRKIVVDYEKVSSID